MKRTYKNPLTTPYDMVRVFILLFQKHIGQSNISHFRVRSRFRTTVPSLEKQKILTLHIGRSGVRSTRAFLLFPIQDVCYAPICHGSLMLLAHGLNSGLLGRGIISK